MRRNNYTVSLSNGKFGEINSFCVIKKTEIATDSECMIASVKFINVSKTESVLGRQRVQGLLPNIVLLSLALRQKLFN